MYGNTHALTTCLCLLMLPRSLTPTPHPTRESTESRTSKKNPFSRMQHKGSWCRAGGWAEKRKLFAGIFWWARRRELFQENSTVREGEILVFSLVNEWTKTRKSREGKSEPFGWGITATAENIGGNEHWAEQHRATHQLLLLPLSPVQH